MSEQANTRILKSILVFFDGSLASRHAFDLGVNMAAMYRAKMVIISVIPSREAEAMFVRGQDYPFEERRALCLSAKDQGVQCQYRIDTGEAAERIICAVEEHDADLVIMGQQFLPAQSGNFETRLEAILKGTRCMLTMTK